MIALKGFSSYKSAGKKLAIATVTLFALYQGAEKFIHEAYPAFEIHGISMMPSVEPKTVQKTTVFFGTPSRHDVFMISPEHLNSDRVTHPSDGPYIKRIVGLPGDTLRFRMENGSLTHLNGKKINHAPTSKHGNGYSLTSRFPESEGATFANYPFIADFGDIQYPVFLPSEKAFASNDSKLAKYTKIAFHYPWLKKHEVNGYAEITIPEGAYFVLSDNRVASTDSRHFGLVPEDALKYKVIRE